MSAPPGWSSDVLAPCAQPCRVAPVQARAHVSQQGPARSVRPSATARGHRLHFWPRRGSQAPGAAWVRQSQREALECTGPSVSSPGPGTSTFRQGTRAAVPRDPGCGADADVCVGQWSLGCGRAHPASKLTKGTGDLRIPVLNERPHVSERMQAAWLLGAQTQDAGVRGAARPGSGSAQAQAALAVRPGEEQGPRPRSRPSRAVAASGGSSA